MAMPAPDGLAGFIFDIDGCVARGSQALPGVPATLATLRARGFRCAFLSNENQRTRAEVVAKLNGMGIPATVDDVVTAAVVAAEVVQSLHPGRRVLAIGAAGLREALIDRGVPLVDPAHAAEAEVVVMGRDPDFGQQTLNLVCQAIWSGADFIATNLDARVPAASGFVPATGPMIKAVAYATGKEPLVCGKPSRWAGRMALHAIGLAPEQGAVVGDQLEQDIGMGKAAGLFTILVLTGATTADGARAAPAALQPDLVLPDVNALPAWLERQPIAPAPAPIAQAQ
jgi:HAD superfamily hydrolase (TIGR01450 family)